jgi:hypothetical protein
VLCTRQRMFYAEGHTETREVGERGKQNTIKRNE